MSFLISIILGDIFATVATYFLVGMSKYLLFILGVSVSIIVTSLFKAITGKGYMNGAIVGSILGAVIGILSGS